MRTSASLLSSDLNANPHPLEIVRGGDETEIEDQLRKSIAERAYQLYEAEGRPAARNQEHWLQAEREVLQKVTQIRESGAWVVANLHVPNVPAEGFKLLVSEERALLEVEEPIPARAAERSHSPCRFLFYVARWPGCVDPHSASAYVKNGMVTLEAKLKLYKSLAKPV
jgi:hypothetical protein